MDINSLEKIGLTNSESKVYMALIELGESSTGKIIARSKIASSKIYENLDKLINKGLVTTFMEGHIKHYKAANPKRLLDYIQEQKEELKGKEDRLNKLLPGLQQAYNENKEDFEVEVFKGYKGVFSAFMDAIEELDKKDEFMVIGGGNSPSTNQRTKLFFENIHRKRSDKGIILKIIFSEARRKSYKNMAIFPHTIPKYLPNGMPSTTNIYKDTTILVTMSPTPAAIRIKDKRITASYREYFDKMWNIAKK